MSETESTVPSSQPDSSEAHDREQNSSADQKAHEDEQTEEEAGTYAMFQFQSPTSILYKRVFSKEGPHPLAYAAVLRKELRDLETAMALDVEARIIGAAQEAAQAPIIINCPHCGKPQPPDVVQRMAENKVAFCASCHQKL